MFERENKREKILEARNRELRLKQKQRTSAAAREQEQQQEITDFNDAGFFDGLVKQAESDFYQAINIEMQKNKPQQEEQQDVSAEND